MNINHLGQVNMINNDIESTTSEFKNLNNNIQIKQVEKSDSLDNDYSKEELDKSLKKLNKFLEDDKAHAEYSVHEDLGSIMIKIVDDKTKEVILEVPPKKILDMVASMCKQFGLLDKKA
ncbi:flagellar protein FlaG [Clostridium botulinum]|uniref:flagellar protein FlaG n=1 Tax=Clostridium botulinum TaxID=1491 RepID=UPI0005977BF0|nr:flagellar protein FlaG [Clostridium botulinum]KIL09018.1 flagellar protein FlaG [Clostridium botulinum]MBY6932707.1 flagellar protein FlaG [Clostridium botulinum]NFL83472.1 flagellar protein FlaG [Clostridium botulinum]NFN11009.1 flagellar protein FlaG [Clostridium botulinum]NFO35857.1 flagellar protein FlaG [Clostridium botulinum]